MHTDHSNRFPLPEESLLSHFKQGFEHRFPDTVFTCNAEVFTIPAPNSEIGRLRIFDDGHELTVDIGDITHGHFDGSTTDTDAPDIPSICAEVLDFWPMYSARISSSTASITKATPVVVAGGRETADSPHPNHPLPGQETDCAQARCPL